MDEHNPKQIREESKTETKPKQKSFEHSMNAEKSEIRQKLV